MNLLERIDHWVGVAPTATAHISGDRKLTFGQLGAYSNALAAHLLNGTATTALQSQSLGTANRKWLSPFSAW